MKAYLNQIKYNKIAVDILRLDILQPIIQGNKYFKLKHNIKEAKRLNKDSLISFGGAYSNHIHALAIFGKLESFHTIGIIRSDFKENLNPTLLEAKKNGMQLIFCNRTDYRNFRHLLAKDKLGFFDLLKKYIPHIEELKAYIIPEGGTNLLAIKGCQEILNHIDEAYDYICCPLGTAGTAVGLISSSKESKLIGFASLKGNFFHKEINHLLASIGQEDLKNWSIVSDYHFGAYGAFTPSLIAFIEKFYNRYNIPLDPIYTGKMFYGIFDMIDKKKFTSKDKILAIHTGGLQGIEGFNIKQQTYLKSK